MGDGDDRTQHGTGMAGIALYGTLTDLLTPGGPVRLRHRLESVKLLPPPPGHNEEKDYGPFTIQAVARAEVQAPEPEPGYLHGRNGRRPGPGPPSLWSATVDQLCSGALDDGQRLLFISAGNLRSISDAGYIYHRSNCEDGGIEDPGQAWNAVTVGAFTEKVLIRDPSFQVGSQSPRQVIYAQLAGPPSRGQRRAKRLALKPDIVMEGGNYAERRETLLTCPDLSLLTTTLPPGARKASRDHPRYESCDGGRC